MGTLTARPQNVVGLIDEQLQLQCASDTSPNRIIWSYDDSTVSDRPCVSDDPRFTMAYNNSDQCYLNVQGNATTRLILSGPYTCDDGTLAHEAVVIIIGQCDFFSVAVSFLAACVHTRTMQS